MLRAGVYSVLAWTSNPPHDKPADYFEPYSHFARSTRLWFLAYGVGAPLAILSNEWLLEALSEAGHLALLAWLFLAGVCLQIIMTLIWRTSMWYQYFVAYQPKLKETFWYRASVWVSERYWLEVVPDIVTLGLFWRGNSNRYLRSM